MYKLKQELPKEFKIKVKPEQSEALQKHLLSIGVVWNGKRNVSEIKHTNHPYLYLQNLKLLYDFEICKTTFKKDPLPQIKFKDYFEKIEEVINVNLLDEEDYIAHNQSKKETPFPKNWCILVTEDNYKELDVWMHRNWKNYENYTDKWKISKKSIGHYFSNKTSFGYGGHSYQNLKEASIANCALITTEQFRAQYGDLRPKEVEIVNSEPFDKLTLENQKLKNENQGLKSQIEQLKSFDMYYYKRKSHELRQEKFDLNCEIKTLKQKLENSQKDIEKKIDVILKQLTKYKELKNLLNYGHKFEIKDFFNKELNDELLEIKKYNEDLKEQVGIYYKKNLILTEKLETIKKVLE